MTDYENFKSGLDAANVNYTEFDWDLCFDYVEIHTTDGGSGGPEGTIVNFQFLRSTGELLHTFLEEASQPYKS